MKDLIREVFESKFDEAKYTKFLNELLVDYDREKYFSRKNSFPDMYNDFVSSYSRLGTYHAPSGEKIDNLVVWLKKAYSVDAARNAQRNFVAHHLRMYDNKDAALVAFVSPDSPDWRFSFVRSTIENVRQESGKFKLTNTISSAKRWSYLVGENERSHTAQSMFLPLIEKAKKPELSDLINAFDIETVTDEFFEAYKNLFFRVKEATDTLIASDPLVREEFESKIISTADFSKKLLGQIVFLYFLQKKGWLGVDEEGKWGTGSKRFLRDLFEMKYTLYRNFFNDILEHLFYEALASDRSSYNHFSTLFNCRLPFLNGGLFDPVGGYNWSHTHILLPNELFSNSEKTRQGDIGSGILDIFDRFNFTVKEDEPLEKEVAVDPEMLGKVFENLLEVNDRKSTGTFYTPRSVVYYMCRESIVRYLEPHIQHAISDDEIRDFIRLSDFTAEKEAHVASLGKETETYKYVTPECIRKNAALIDDLLSKVKICDPAIGSGAFPVGILTEIVKIRMMLTPYIEEKEGRTAYNFKRNCIQNSIYGVDISPGAVEIAKLRLWLSLVVDEDNADDVKPLPNLDYKIVTGNSLLRVQEQLFEEVDTQSFENMKITFFSETNSDRKKAEKEKIDNLISQRAGGVNTFDFPLYFSEVFSGDTPGFDIVIGNPPYIQLQSFKGKPEHALYREQGFTTYEATGDIYCLFYERGLKITKKGKGILSYITSNKWMRAGYGQKLRDFLANKDPLILLDFAGVKVFKNATVDTNVILVRDTTNNNRLEGAVFNTGFTKGDDIQDYFDRNKSIMQIKSGSSWTAGSTAELNLKTKIENLGKPLKNWDIEIYSGIKTGLNNAFIIDDESRNKLIAHDPKSGEIIKPLLRGRDIKRYGYEWDGLYLIATGFDIDVPTLYPALYNHLKQYETKAKARGDKGANWYNLRACAYYEAFDDSKIIWSDIATEPNFTFCDPGIFFNNTVYMIVGEKLNYLLGVLNSSYSKYYFSNNATDLGAKGNRYFKQFVELIPIPVLNEKNNPLINEIEALVRKIYKEQEPLAVITKEIDELVYKLFDLTEEEIAIIEKGK